MLNFLKDKKSSLKVDTTPPASRLNVFDNLKAKLGTFLIDKVTEEADAQGLNVNIPRVKQSESNILNVFR